MSSEWINPDYRGEWGAERRDREVKFRDAIDTVCRNFGLMFVATDDYGDFIPLEVRTYSESEFDRAMGYHPRMPGRKGSGAGR